jgi:small GTP-binding protein
VFIVADQGNIDSFKDIKSHWMNEVKEHSDPGTTFVLLLNKMDIQEKALDPAEVEAFAQQEGLLLYETSAKTGKNVNGVFTEVCQHLIKEQ